MFAVVAFLGPFPPIISAVVTPVLQAMNASQTPADGWLASANDTANYSSTAGTISTAVREVSVNGEAFTATLTADLDTNDTVAGRVVVTDSAANVRTFDAGTVIVNSGSAGIGSGAIGTTFQVAA